MCYDSLQLRHNNDDFISFVTSNYTYILEYLDINTIDIDDYRHDNMFLMNSDLSKYKFNIKYSIDDNIDNMKKYYKFIIFRLESKLHNDERFEFGMEDCDDIIYLINNRKFIKYFINFLILWYKLDIISKTENHILTIFNKNTRYVYEKRDLNNTIIKHVAAEYDEAWKILTDYSKYILTNRVLIIPEGIDIIGANQYKNCKYTDITFPSTLTHIGNSAFRHIGNSAFRHSEKLSTITFHENTLKLIGYYAFYKCTSLRAISLQSNIIRVGAFAHCTALETIILYNVENIEENAFSNCTALETITLNDVENIEENAFSNCTALETITLNDVNNIEENAFRNCTSLKTITLDNVENISDTAFIGCTNVTNIETTNESFNPFQYRFRDDVEIYIIGPTTTLK
jgi:hypothetical protein